MNEKCKNCGHAINGFGKRWWHRSEFLGKCQVWTSLKENVRCLCDNPEPKEGCENNG